MDKKVDLIGKLIITYVFILALCFLLYALVVLPVNGAEKVNAIIGLLGWSATIYAPIAAYFLLDNWKDQKKYEIKKDIIFQIFERLNNLHYTQDLVLTQIKLIRDNYESNNVYYTKVIFTDISKTTHETVSILKYIRRYNKVINNEDLQEKLTYVLTLLDSLMIFSKIFVNDFYKPFYDSISTSELISYDYGHNIKFNIKKLPTELQEKYSDEVIKFIDYGMENLFQEYANINNIIDAIDESSKVIEKINAIISENFVKF